MLRIFHCYACHFNLLYLVNTLRRLCFKLMFLFSFYAIAVQRGRVPASLHHQAAAFAAANQLCMPYMSAHCAAAAAVSGHQTSVVSSSSIQHHQQHHHQSGTAAGGLHSVNGAPPPSGIPVTPAAAPPVIPANCGTGTVQHHQLMTSYNGHHGNPYQHHQQHSQQSQV